MEHADFIAAILADPHDLQARLVFADYLEEIGDPRAELIRLQFEQQDLRLHDPLRKKLRTRELKVLRQHGKFGRLPPVAKELSAMGGFVDAIEITIQRFLNHHQEIFESSPVRRVAFKGYSKKIRQLAQCSCLSNLAGLKLKNHSEDSQQYIELLTSEHLKHLEELSISGEWINADVMATISRHPNFAKLQDFAVYLPSSATGTATVFLPHGERQALRSFDPGGLDFIHGSCFERLRNLEVHGLGKSDVTPLTSSSNLEHLERLWLVGSAVSREMMLAVQSCSALSQLQQLKLSHGYYYYGAEIQEESPVPVQTAMPDLLELEIIGNFGSAMIPDITRNYRKLEVLRLSDNRVDDAGVDVLLESELFQNLRALYLTNNELTVKGAERLGSARPKGLKLYLDGNPISPSEANQLRKKFGKSFLSASHHFYGG